MASSKITKIVKNYSADFDRRREGLPEIISTVNGHADDIDGLDTRVTALEETNPEIPAHTSADAGKFLGVDSEGGLAFDYAPDDELPDYSIADAGKFLGVDAQGELSFADIVTPEAGVGPEVIAELYAAVAPASSYTAGDVVVYNDGYTDEFYECLITGTTASPNVQTDWQVIHIEEIGEWGGNVPAGGYTTLNDTLYHNKRSSAAWFNPSNPTASGDFEVVTYTTWSSTPVPTYSAGDYVMYANELYVCTGTTSGAFDPTKWTKVDVTSQLGSKLPAYGSEDATKILMVGYQGQSLIWTPTPQELPSRTAADIGKILSVYSANGLIWVTPPEGVPAHTAAESGKFLGVDSSGNLIWGTSGGGSGATTVSLTDASSMPNGPFTADSDDTTFTSVSDVVTALQSGADIKVLIADAYNTFGAYPLILSAAQEPGYMIPSGNTQRPVAWVYLFDISPSMADPSNYTWEFRS